MRDVRPFEWIVSDKSSSELSDQKRLSILSWTAGPKGGKVANSMVGSLHIILLQEAETHDHEIVTCAEQQFHVHQGADHLIHCNKSTFEADSVKILFLASNTCYPEAHFHLKFKTSLIFHHEMNGNILKLWIQGFSSERNKYLLSFWTVSFFKSGFYQNNVF